MDPQWSADRAVTSGGLVARVPTTYGRWRGGSNVAAPVSGAIGRFGDVGRPTRRTWLSARIEVVEALADSGFSSWMPSMSTVVIRSSVRTATNWAA